MPLEKIWLKHYAAKTPHEVNLAKYQNIHQVFSEAVAKYSTLPAFSNFGVQLTFAELNSKVEDLASFLQNELQLQKGDRVAVQMPNLLQFPIITFAALKLGLVLVNTNPLYTAKEMKHQFKDSGAKAVFILANYAHLLQEVIKETSIESVIITQIGDQFPAPKRIFVNAAVKYLKKMVPAYSLPQAYTFLQALQIGALNSATPNTVEQEDIAFLQYTGGTTGVSKGAILTHKNIIANMLQIGSWMAPRLIDGKEIAIAALPMYHIFSLTVNCLAFLSYGAHNILITNPRDIKAFIKELKQYPFTIMTGVNTLYNALMNHPDFQSIDFSSIKISVAGAMALQKSVSTRWHELTNTPVVEGYGLTEASPVVCCNPIDGTDRVGTIGLPVPNTEIKLVNDELQEVSAGETGELCCKGPQVMQGYWQRPDETEKVLKDGWLYTGDIASVDKDGFFKIVDRKKDMILVSGFNVYPNEVEDAIASHPDVLEVAAVGIADEHSGESVKVFVVKKNPQVSESDIIEHARKSLTGYKVPKAVEFRNELPKTNVGKILRRALRETKTQS
ncbi:MAG: AMP-binding protein [Pseudobdellovibrionaceae bacterium]